jgi:hypothetical protein
MLLPLTTLLYLGSPDASALEAETETPPVIEILSNPLARWDNTRWRVDMQVGLPYPVVLYAEFNAELQVVAMDVRLVFHCQRDGGTVRGRGEATCRVEDAAISAAPWVANPPHADVVLQETDRRLTGLRFQLQVDSAGRVLDIGLLDEPQTNERVNTMYENLRQIVSRAVLGFHVVSPDTYVVGAEHYERNTRLMTIPSFRYSVPSMARPLRQPTRLSSDGEAFFARDTNPNGSPRQPALQSQATNNGTLNVGEILGQHARLSMGTAAALGPFAGSHPMEVFLAPASYGRNNVVHRMDPYKGSYVVQSVGEGSADIGADVPIVYMGHLTAVAVFDPGLGYMAERRWTVSMSPTASSLVSEGVAGWPYWQIGSIQLLNPTEETPLGPSVVVAPPQHERGNLPPWPSL